MKLGEDIEKYIMCCICSMLTDKHLEIAERLIEVIKLYFHHGTFRIKFFYVLAKCCPISDVCYGKYHVCGVTETSLYCTSGECAKGIIFASSNTGICKVRMIV